MNRSNDGKSLAHDNDSSKMCGDHSLKGGVSDLKSDHKSGVKHDAVRDMKGIK